MFRAIYIYISLNRNKEGPINSILKSSDNDTSAPEKEKKSA